MSASPLIMTTYEHCPTCHALLADLERVAKGGPRDPALLVKLLEELERLAAGKVDAE